MSLVFSFQSANVSRNIYCLGTTNILGIDFTCRGTRRLVLPESFSWEEYKFDQP